MRILTIYLFIPLLLINCSSNKKSYDYNYENFPQYLAEEDFFHVTIRSKVYQKNFKPSSKRIFVFPKVSEISINNPWFRFFSEYIYMSLENNGYKIAKIPEKAEIGILLYYGVDFPQKYTYSKTVPVKGNTKKITSYDPRKSIYELPIIKKNSGIREIIKYHTQTATTYFYRRIITVEAIDLIRYRQTDGLNADYTIWKTTMISDGNTNDLGYVFPQMVAASHHHIGKNLERTQEERIGPYDKRFISLFNGVNSYKRFINSIEEERNIRELYYMVPPTSRDIRLRKYEEAQAFSF